MKKIAIAAVLLLGAVIAWYYLKYAKITITKIDLDARSFDYEMKTARHTVTGSQKLVFADTGNVQGREGFYIDAVKDGFLLHIDNLNGWTMKSKFFNTKNL